MSEVWREDRPLFSAAVHRFGNWQNALKAAGFQTKPRRRWSKERIIQELRAWYDRSEANLRAGDPALAGAAARFFGSLQAAQEAAGLKPASRRWFPERVLAAIEDRHRRGLPIRCPGFGDLRLATAAKRRFGSWANAVAAAGLAAELPATAPVRSWTKDSVLDAIRRAYRPEAGVKAIWKHDTGLYSAAKKHFGTWRSAVVAAGLEPAHRQWTPEAVVQEIQAWHRRGSWRRWFRRPNGSGTASA